MGTQSHSQAVRLAPLGPRFPPSLTLRRAQAQPVEATLRRRVAGTNGGFGAGIALMHTLEMTGTTI